jgi:hypothetical protein
VTGLQEQVRVLTQERDGAVLALEKQKQETAAARAALGQDFAERLARVKEDYQARLADLESQVNDHLEAKLALGRELTALRACLEQQRRLPEVRENRWQLAFMTLLVMTMVLIFFAGYLALRFCQLRALVNRHVIRQAGLVRVLGDDS